MLALIKLDVNGRLSIVGNLKHAILDRVANGVHGVGVRPHSNGRHVDWHVCSARARGLGRRSGTKRVVCDGINGDETAIGRKRRRRV